MLNEIVLNTELPGKEGAWSFVGVPRWKQDHDGIIYPPVWSYPNFDQDPEKIPDNYAHELGREDYAFLASRALADTDVSVDYRCPYHSVLHGGIVFRAADSARFYVVDVIDMGRKGQYYELTLWLQEKNGYRKELGQGKAPHSIVMESIVQTGPKTRAEWNNSSPDWVTVRVQASGSYIRVSMDGQIVFEVRDKTYPAGRVGLVGRGAVSFRNLRVSGIPSELPDTWEEHEGELPNFFYPGGEQPEGFNAYPVTCRSVEGGLLAAWGHSPIKAKPRHCQSVVFTRSDDGGSSWSRYVCVYDAGAMICNPSSIFSHKDGKISCLARVWPKQHGKDPEKTVKLVSSDGGKTWDPPEEVIAGNRPLSEIQGLYSSMMRLSDGTVVMCGYEADVVPGGDPGSNADRLDRSLFLRSTDDGHTWQEPVYFDPENFDQNECAVAETGPGELVAFMRTLSAPNMWTSVSKDGGLNWSPLVQSNVNAECPCLLMHSSGVLILGSRGYGTFINLSFDRGRTWSKMYRLSPASAMIGMAEMEDGRVFIIMHEGYRVPGNVRGRFFTVSELTAEARRLDSGR